MTTWNKQIENRNFLSPIGFKFLLAKYPKIAYFAQSANIPNINLGITERPTPFRSLPVEGFMEYDPLNITFIIDEDLENYMILHNWMRGLGVPDNFSERQSFEDKDKEKAIGDFPFADATLTVLSSNFKPNFNVVFRELKPVSLTTLEFDSSLTDTDYFTATVEFDYISYQVQDLLGNRIDKLK